MGIINCDREHVSFLLLAPFSDGLRIKEVAEDNLDEA